MQVKTELRNMFSYSLIPIIFLFIILVILFLLIIYKKKKTTKIVKPSYKDLISIKNTYIFRINKLVSEYNSNTISSRKAYQELSIIIRNFIYEATNIKVQNYTLEEIKKINIPILYQLVSEYYDPEFAKYSEGNILESINKTRMVIERWY